MSSLGDDEKKELRSQLRGRLKREMEEGRKPSRSRILPIPEPTEDSLAKEIRDAFQHQEELLQRLIHEAKKQTKLLEEIRDHMGGQKKDE